MTVIAWLRMGSARNRPSSWARFQRHWSMIAWSFSAGSPMRWGSRPSREEVEEPSALRLPGGQLRSKVIGVADGMLTIAALFSGQLRADFRSEAGRPGMQLIGLRQFNTLIGCTAWWPSSACCWAARRWELPGAPADGAKDMAFRGERVCLLAGVAAGSGAQLHGAGGFDTGGPPTPAEHFRHMGIALFFAGVVVFRLSSVLGALTS